MLLYYCKWCLSAADDGNIIIYRGASATTIPDQTTALQRTRRRKKDPYRGEGARVRERPAAGEAASVHSVVRSRPVRVVRRCSALASYSFIRPPVIIISNRRAGTRNTSEPHGHARLGWLLVLLLFCGEYLPVKYYFSVHTRRFPPPPIFCLRRIFRWNFRARRAGSRRVRRQRIVDSGVVRVQRSFSGRSCARKTSLPARQLRVNRNRMQFGLFRKGRKQMKLKDPGKNWSHFCVYYNLFEHVGKF